MLDRTADNTSPPLTVRESAGHASERDPRLGGLSRPCFPNVDRAGPAALARHRHPPLFRVALPCHRPCDQPHKRTHCSETDDLDHRSPHLSHHESRAGSRMPYAARRWAAKGGVTASLCRSTLPARASGDPLALRYTRSRQTNKVATIAISPLTIPQYPHDMGHTLAWNHASPLLGLSRRHAIDPVGLAVLHLFERLDFPAPGAEHDPSKKHGCQH